MKAKEVQQMFKDLGLTQLFTRPRTLDDNPFVEALFAAVKTTPTYPGWFPSNDATVVARYFERYFTWYDHEHHHSRIGYVTPFQKHTGQAEAILLQRKKLTAETIRNIFLPDVIKIGAVSVWCCYNQMV